RCTVSAATLSTLFCGPLLPPEIVDAVTGPPAFFPSDRGSFDPSGARSLSPPRHDLAPAQCKVFGAGCSSGCDSASCPMLADLDDVAVVSGAAPSPFAAGPV